MTAQARGGWERAKRRLWYGERLVSEEPKSRSLFLTGAMLSSGPWNVLPNVCVLLHNQKKKNCHIGHGKKTVVLRVTSMHPKLHCGEIPLTKLYGTRDHVLMAILPQWLRKQKVERRIRGHLAVFENLFCLWLYLIWVERELRRSLGEVTTCLILSTQM